MKRDGVVYMRLLGIKCTTHCHVGGAAEAFRDCYNGAKPPLVAVLTREQHTQLSEVR